MNNKPAPTSSLVDLPGDVDLDSDFDVYVSGVIQESGTDYQLDGRTLVFPKPLTAEIKMTKFQFIRAALGVAGTYAKHDSIDVIYKRDGRAVVATGLRPRDPDQPAS